MIAIDSSALLAIFLDEPERQLFIDVIGSHPERVMSPVNLLETRIVLLSRAGEQGIYVFESFLQQAGIVLKPVDSIASDIAFQAFRHYGKGRGHPAQLNFGDCFAYALAKQEGAPTYVCLRAFGAVPQRRPSPRRQRRHQPRVLLLLLRQPPAPGSCDRRRGGCAHAACIASRKQRAAAGLSRHAAAAAAVRPVLALQPHAASGGCARGI